MDTISYMYLGPVVRYRVYAENTIHDIGDPKLYSLSYRWRVLKSV